MSSKRNYSVKKIKSTRDIDNFHQREDDDVEGFQVEPLKAMGKTTKRTIITSPTSVKSKSMIGLMGNCGITFRVIWFLVTITSEAILLTVLWKQVERKRGYYDRQKHRTTFVITLIIALLPMVLLNILSIIWYCRKRRHLADRSIFANKNGIQKLLCVIAHLFQLSPLMRYFDIVSYGRKKTYTFEWNRQERGTAPVRKATVEPTSAYTQSIILKDTELLDILRSFFQDCPQLIFQAYLIVQNTQRFVNDDKSAVAAAQIWRLVVALVAISWSVVAYQEALRISTFNGSSITGGGAFVCFIWRFCELSSRVLAIISFAALQVNSEGGLVKIYSENAPRGFVMSFAVVAIFVLAVHFVVMTIWIYSSHQKTIWNVAEGSKLFGYKFLSSVLMGWIHVFCYLSTAKSLSRRRMGFFYLIIAIENSVFVVVCFLQLLTVELWLRVSLILATELLLAIGISCAVCYYAFLHRQDINVPSSKS